MRVEVVAIGDELLLGFTVDSNGPHIARELAELGVTVDRRTIVGDVHEEIRTAVGEALARTGAVVTTGGLGPTSDDVTRSAVASLFDRELKVDESHLAWMRERWRARLGRELPESNIAQALVPEGAQVLRNAHGSAPGLLLEDERGWVAMLPGVPRELRGMVGDTLLPLVAGRAGSGAVVRSRTIRTTGIPESALSDMVRSAAIPLGDLALAYLPSPDGVDLRLTARRLPADVAGQLLENAGAALRAVAGAACYAEGSADLVEVVLDLCRERKLTIAVAESCTGGMLGERITSVAGSSDVFLGGVIAYADSVKRDRLGVPAEVLAAHGAVSEPVAARMAAAVRELTGASIGIAITGVAGPGGGTAEKPVGTVWIAVDGVVGIEAVGLRLWGDRAEIRHRSSQAALDLVRRRLERG